MAAIAPLPCGTASCISRPRKRTSSTAAENSSAPAHTSAVNSPRLWPDTSAGGPPPRPPHTRQVATPAASMAGWVRSVAFRSSSGPALVSFHRS